MRFIGGPVGGFEVEVAAEEVVEGWARGVGHFRVRRSSAVVPFVVLAWAREGSEGGVDVGLFGLGWGGGGGGLGDGGAGGGGGEGESGGAFGGMGHEDERAEDVGAGEGTDGGSHGAEVVADDGGAGVIAEGRDDGEGVFDEGDGAEGGLVEGV